MGGGGGKIPPEEITTAGLLTTIAGDDRDGLAGAEVDAIGGLLVL